MLNKEKFDIYHPEGDRNVAIEQENGEIIYITWEEGEELLNSSGDSDDDSDQDTFKFNYDQSVYNQPSAERHYIWKVAGQTLYVNEEKFRHLRQMYHWDELQELTKHSRCQVEGK